MFLLYFSCLLYSVSSYKISIYNDSSQSNDYDSLQLGDYYSL